MSDSITLSDELISNVYSVIVQHDQSAEQNMMLALQYMAAVTGYLAAGFPGAAAERDDLIDQLAAFTKHVAEEEAGASQQQEQGQPQQVAAPEVQKGKSEATDDPAIGIWKPE